MSASYRPRFLFTYTRGGGGKNEASFLFFFWNKDVNGLEARDNKLNGQPRPIMKEAFAQQHTHCVIYIP